MSTFGAPYGSVQGAGDDPARPPTIREQVRASKEFFAANSHQDVVTAAQRVITQHWGAISQFILGQRQMGMVLPASYKRKDYPDLSMEYQRLGNQETVILTAYPETDNPQAGLLDVEYNYDGYFMWAHCEANYNGQTTVDPRFIPGPYDIFFNEYVLEDRFQPARPYGGYLVLFGQTALLCQSIQDTTEKNTLKLDAQKKDLPYEVTPRPGWGVYDDGSTPAGVSQDKIDKILGYWLFDWQNPHNPCMSIINPYSYGGGNNQPWSKIAGNNGAGTPNITKGLWLRHADKSMLDYKGKNNHFYVALSPGGNSGEEILAGQFFAEFYDRSKVRTVKQSWTKSMRDGYEVNVSDSPTRFGTAYNYGAFFGGGGISVDLTPGQKDPGLGPHDGVDAYSPNSAGDFTLYLSPTDLATYKAWQNDVTQKLAQYNKTIADAIKAWTDKWNQKDNLKLLNQADNVEAFLRNITDAEGNNLPWVAAFDDRTRSLQEVDGNNYYIYGPVQEYLYDWNAPYSANQGHGGTPLPTVQNRYLFDVSFGKTLLQDTNGNPGSASADPTLYGGTFFGGGFLTFQAAVALAHIYVKDESQDAELRKANEYNKIFTDNKPPKLPDRPKLGKDYTQFSYRAITGGGNDYSYGEWSGK